MNEERKLQTKVIERIKQRVPWAFVAKWSDRYLRGMPDLFFFAANLAGEVVVFGIEIKLPGEKQSEIQKVVESQIKHAVGGCEDRAGYVVVRSVEEIDQLLAEWGF